MLHLKENPTLRDIQTYVQEMEVERGFDTTSSNVQTALQLGEEIADVLMFISAIANRYNIDLEKALRDKEEINKQRQWKS